MTPTPHHHNSESHNKPYHIQPLSLFQSYNLINNISVPKLIIDLRRGGLFEKRRLRNAINVPIRELWDAFVEKYETPFEGLGTPVSSSSSSFDDANLTKQQAATVSSSPQVSTNDFLAKYGKFDDDSEEIAQRRLKMSIEEKEAFWRFVQEDPFNLLPKKSFDEFEYRGTVYKRAILYADSQKDVEKFMLLFRHDTNKLSPQERQELSITDYCDIPPESLANPKETTKYKSFAKSTVLIYMKKNFKLKQLMSMPMEEFETKFPFLFTSPEKKALEGEMPAMVNDFLFLGGYNHACNREQMQALKIEYIHNMAAELDNKFEDTEFESADPSSDYKWSITYKKLGIDDTVKDSVLLVLEEALQFIEEAKKNNKRILVHCAMGISRGPSVVISWLMKHHGWTFEEAKGFVKQCRSCIKPNPAFTKQLEGQFQEKIQSFAEKKRQGVEEKKGEW